MGVDLGLNVGDRYTIALVMFFPTYFLFELPSNIVLRKVGSANWLAFIALSWGAVMIGQGFVKSWQTLTVCRALLGFFEAGFFPGCTFPSSRLSPSIVADGRRCLSDHVLVQAPRDAETVRNVLVPGEIH